MNHRYWCKGDKFFCSQCSELIGIFAHDFFYTDRFDERTFVPGSQRFLFLDPPNCKVCGHNFWADLKKGKIE